MTLRDIKRTYYRQAEKSVKTKQAKAAEWLARHGYYVLPLHPGTKDPATAHGVYDATTDPGQIRRWWAQNPRYNVGIHCGPSGLLVVDADTYKAGAGTVDLPDTVKVETAHKGTHYWYRMPEGKRYGNVTGTLPEWLDIRGWGGYVVAPTSVLIEDGAALPYAFIPGYKPTEIEIANLPADIAAILDEAQNAKVTAEVHFSAHVGAAPDLAQWPLSAETLVLIRNGHPAGADRSSYDQKVITALIYAGASDDDIRDVFAYYAIGAKYIEKGRSSDKYLARSIGKARVYVEDHPPDHGAPATHERLAAARRWGRSSACIEHLRASGECRVADLLKSVDALFEIAMTKRSARIITTMIDLADRYNVGSTTAWRHVNRLEGAGLLTTRKHQFGTLIDLTPLLDLSEIVSPSVDHISPRSTSEEDFFAEHRADDAFTSYPYTYALKRREMPTDVALPYLGDADGLLWVFLEHGPFSRPDLLAVTGWEERKLAAVLWHYKQVGLVVVIGDEGDELYQLHNDAVTRLKHFRQAPTVLMQSLGASGLLLWDALLDGGTVKELAAITGLTVAAVRVTLRRFEQAGLLVTWQEGRAKVYELHPNAWDRLEERREHMVTAGSGQMRAGRNASSQANYAEYKLQSRLPLEQREKMRLENRRDRADGKAAAHKEALWQMGIDPHAKVRHRPPRPRQRFDAAEEWRSWACDLWEVWQLLGEGEYQDKIRLLTIAEVGEDASDELYRKVRQHISERVDLALSLAPRRARLQQVYCRPDWEDSKVSTPTPVVHPVLFEVAA